MPSSQWQNTRATLSKVAAAGFTLFVGVFVLDWAAHAGFVSVFIHNGTPDTKHTYVVQITIGKGAKATYCTGSVVGPSVILTAAHCISGHETEQFFYDIEPAAGAKPKLLPISKGAYPGFAAKMANVPTPPQNCGLCYDPSNNYIHDIGLLFTDTAIPAAASMAQLPKAALSWAHILRNQGKGLVFSGYGLINPADDATAKNRNEGTWPIDYTDDWRLYYQPDSKTKPIQSTCSGDSGGPTIYTMGGVDFIVGVTSVGNKGVCTLGISTRVDAYLDWLHEGYKQETFPLGQPPAH